MNKFNDLTGKKFGAITVIKRVESVHGKSARFLCRCDCGNEKEIDGTSLKRGLTKSCGCRINIMENFIGKRFGRLVAVEETESRTTPNGSKERRYLCRCDCGKTTNISRAGLQGGTQSCGCLAKEVFTANRRTNIFPTVHGKRHTRLYHIWLGIKQKCFNPNNPEYKRYGARGITVCDEWRNDFQAFYEWSMVNGYKEEIISNGKNKWTIDRINVNGNYEPNNCRWADMLTQGNNKRDNHLITYQGETLTLAETARKFGVSNKVLSSRLCDGWGIEEAIKTPLNPQKHTTRKSLAKDKRRKENRRA